MAISMGVMGAGAIGCFVGGRLSASGASVLLIGRARVKQEIEASGLSLFDLGSAPSTLVPAKDLRFETEPAALAGCDVVLVCVKSGQTAETAETLASVLPKGTLVVSLQNGLKNADVLRARLFEQIVLGGVVGFNVVASGQGTFRRATSGPLVIERPADLDDARIAELAHALETAGFETDLSADIVGVQWSKLVMNLNNAVSALTDVATPRLLFEAPYRRIVRLIISEALDVFRQARIKPARLGPIPVQLFPLVLGLPTPLLRAIARLQVQIDPDARSSMWDDLVRGRLTEVDQLNGEIVELAARHGMRAPVNQRIVELIHDAERRGQGSPKLGADELWRALRA